MFLEHFVHSKPPVYIDYADKAISYYLKNISTLNHVLLFDKPFQFNTKLLAIELAIT